MDGRQVMSLPWVMAEGGRSIDVNVSVPFSVFVSLWIAGVKEKDMWRAERESARWEDDSSRVPLVCRTVTSL